jgi:putative aldouronate transport system substrate-binding protein
MVAGDKPPDEQTVLDEIERRLADTLNVSLRTIYVPWGDYIERLNMMSAAGDEFDIFLNFGFNIHPAYINRQAIDITDLLDRYGPAIKAMTPADSFLRATVDGRVMAIPATYQRDSIALAGVFRKDLREEMNLPPITNLETLEMFYNGIMENYPHMIPLASMQHYSTTFLSGGLRIPHRPIIHTNPQIVFAYVDDGPDAFVAQNFYTLPEQVALMELGAYAFSQGWFERDVMGHTDHMEARAQFESGRAASFNVDLYNFTSIDINLQANVPGAEMEWVVLTEDRPLQVAPANNWTQISATSKNPERAIMFLNWLLEDQENYQLYMHGIEGVHFTLTPDGLLQFPDGIDAGNNPYDPTPWFIRNMHFHRLSTSESPSLISANTWWANAPRLPLYPIQVAFTMDMEPVAMEVGQIERVIAEQWNPLLVGVRSGEAAYNQFLADLDLAGMPAVIEEFQRQLDAWLAAN